MKHHPFITYQLRKQGEKPQHGVMPIVYGGQITPDESQPEQHLTYSFQEGSASRLGVLALESTLDTVPPDAESHMLLGMYRMIKERPEDQRLILGKTGLYAFHKPADETDRVDRYWVTLPSHEQINNRIKRLNRSFLPPHLALPTFTPFYGGEYDDKQFVNLYNLHGQPILSTGRKNEDAAFDFTYFAHDLIEHFPEQLIAHWTTYPFVSKRMRQAAQDATRALSRKLLFDSNNGMSILGIGQALQGEGSDPHGYIADLVGKENTRRVIYKTREHVAAVAHCLRGDQHPLRGLMSASR